MNNIESSTDSDSSNEIKVRHHCGFTKKKKKNHHRERLLSQFGILCGLRNYFRTNTMTNGEE